MEGGLGECVHLRWRLRGKIPHYVVQICYFHMSLYSSFLSYISSFLFHTLFAVSRFSGFPGGERLHGSMVVVSSLYRLIEQPVMKTYKTTNLWLDRILDDSNWPINEICKPWGYCTTHITNRHVYLLDGLAKPG